MKKILTCLALSATLTACQSTAQQQNANPSSEQPDLNHVWQLQDVPRGFTLPENGQLDLRTPNQASAYMGCNQLHFNAQLDAFSGSLKADGIASTRMHCAEFAQLESRFAQVLREGVEVVHGQDRLRLIDKKGEDWLFERAD